MVANSENAPIRSRGKRNTQLAGGSMLSRLITAGEAAQILACTEHGVYHILMSWDVEPMRGSALWLRESVDMVAKRLSTKGVSHE